MTILLHPPMTGAAARRTSVAGFISWSPRTASLVAGVSLALMAVLAPLGNFGAIAPLIAAGDAAQTAAAIGNAPAQWLFGVVALFLVTILDIVVAAAWYVLFAPVSRVVSAVAAWLRVAFAVGFMVAISQLVVALDRLDDPAAVVSATHAFSTIWLISLGVFGTHLLVIAALAYRSGFVARIFGALLAVAGLGYIADAVGTVFIPGFTAVFGSLLFIGEVAIIFWLLIKGRRLVAAGARTEAVGR
ncbi:DUF4386 domain-containing protein [Glaciibacter sp. 2TAF33]|uniref:DUF4386 domain-containing protein n=1 Tax=Glaciibacter sp. 2TAF33 TaxID=3233015 RepID=UPI003F902747